jgi:hypothetical protein
MFWLDFIAYTKIKTLREYSDLMELTHLLEYFGTVKEVSIIYFIMVCEELKTLI